MIAALSLTFLQSQLNAEILIDWRGDEYHDIPNPGWGGADVLNTYDNVTVTMLGVA
jgi:hypothetical protein